jgi:predicted enzyme related to lactoylglutathione lyase
MSVWDNARMPNPIVRFEIGCKDRESTQAFYASLFDWKITAQGPALAIDTGGSPSGGINALGHEPHHYTMFYVQVSDIAASLARAIELGGKRLVGPIPLPTGSFAWFSDPESNVIGLWQPA